MRDPFANSPEFRKLLGPVSEPEVDLATIALEIASDAYPHLDRAAYLARIDALAERVRERCPAPARPRQLLGQINWVLYVEEGFAGNVDDYYDPRNSYLNEVMDRKLGIPISLAVVHARVARGVGLTLSGVDLPAHFVLRAEIGPEPIFVDAFDSGALHDLESCRRMLRRRVGRDLALDDSRFEPCSRRVVVSRMLRNLEAIHVQSGELTALLPIKRRLAALNSSIPREQRDLGLLCLRLDRPAEAITPLVAYLEAEPDGPDAVDIAALIRAARGEVARWN